MVARIHMISGMDPSSSRMAMDRTRSASNPTCPRQPPCTGGRISGSRVVACPDRAQGAAVSEVQTECSHQCQTLGPPDSAGDEKRQLGAMQLQDAAMCQQNPGVYK